jgi:hypothetical protein
MTKKCTKPVMVAKRVLASCIGSNQAEAGQRAVDDAFAPLAARNRSADIEVQNSGGQHQRRPLPAFWHFSARIQAKGGQQHRDHGDGGYTSEFTIASVGKRVGEELAILAA